MPSARWRTNGQSGFLLVFYSNYRASSSFATINDQSTTDVMPQPISRRTGNDNDSISM